MDVHTVEPTDHKISDVREQFSLGEDDLSNHGREYVATLSAVNLSISYLNPGGADYQVKDRLPVGFRSCQDLVGKWNSKPTYPGSPSTYNALLKWSNSDGSRGLTIVNEPPIQS